MLSNQNYTARVILLSTRCSCTIISGFHYNYLIRFIGWLSFNLLIHSCNMCQNSQKNTSCKSMNKYLSRYLHGVNLGFLLSFCTKYSSFVLAIFQSLPLWDSMVSTSPFIFAFFHLLVIRSGLLLTRLPQISCAQSHCLPISRQQNHLLVFYSLLSIYHYRFTPVHNQEASQQNPLKTIDPPSYPEGNIVHGVHCAVSPEIALWVAAIIKCLQLGNERDM
jgi:hypothetical protein